MIVTAPQIDRQARITESDMARRYGFRFGDKSTHTSRTLMLVELEQVLAGTASSSTPEAYVDAIVNDNLTDKKTAATRRSTSQRLRELYVLDPSVPVFRVLRYLWDRDEDSRPLLALLCALTRDPLLRSTASIVLALPPGDEMPRQQLVQSVLESTGNRLNENIADKAARNIASTWTQSGHLKGRVRKLRQRVHPTPYSLALALFYGQLLGVLGSRMFETLWCTALDGSSDELLRIARDARQLGLIEIKEVEDVREVKLGGWASVPKN